MAAFSRRQFSAEKGIYHRLQNTITQLHDPSKTGPDPFTDVLWKALSEGFRLSVAERAMQRFPRMRGLRKSAAVHAAVGNAFNSERSLFSRAQFKENRAAALAVWCSLCAV
ncbi:MAG: hypothetical protein CMH12_21235 [Maritimibacter sp.]|nr:hypothetical protein [Maritimibacter sp.]